jgi:dTDP-4-amino-4,6-dideoxygalactose transaminase
MTHSHLYPIPFNRPYITGRSLDYIEKTIKTTLWGRGKFTELCELWLEQLTNAPKALLTPSCTGALELAALLINIQPGDEVIVPSYTFVSTANAFVMRGAIPVFIDIRPDTLNIDESLIEQAITARTKAIVAVHYGGVACAMDSIMDIAHRHGLVVIEDAAHALMAKLNDRPLGSIGHLATFSFHETKNITCGQGGALIINDAQYVERARILHDKGTNRFLFSQGKVDKYSWVDVGSNYVLSEINAAFLYGQMEEAEHITQQRQTIWQEYHWRLESLENAGLLKRQHIPPEGSHNNAHLYYLLLPNMKHRDNLIAALAQQGIAVAFHYVPLHQSPMGKRCGRVATDMYHTESISERLVRLPLWVGIEGHIPDIITKINTALECVI